MLFACTGGNGGTAAVEMLSYEFMQRALLAGILTGVLCSVVSFFVVLKKISFAGVGISHSAFGGIALGYILGYPTVLSAGAFAVLVAWGIGAVSKKGKIYEDTAIGIFFSVSMALGVMLISCTKGYYTDLFSFLFGNILAITRADLQILAAATVVVLLFIVLFFKEILFVCFDEEMARVSGVPANFIYFALLTILALTVVVSVKVVGVVLASALLVIPAATGYKLAKNYRLMLVISIASGVAAAVTGLWISYHFGLASGATIVLCAALIFLFSMIFSQRSLKA